MNIKGYTKNLVIVRNIDSDMIDEAYLILKSTKSAADSDIINEANKLIRAYGEKRGKLKSPPPALCFLCGVLCSGIISFLIYSLTLL